MVGGDTDRARKLQKVTYSPLVLTLPIFTHTSNNPYQPLLSSSDNDNEDDDYDDEDDDSLIVGDNDGTSDTIVSSSPLQQQSSNSYSYSVFGDDNSTLTTSSPLSSSTTSYETIEEEDDKQTSSSSSSPPSPSSHPSPSYPLLLKEYFKVIQKSGRDWNKELQKLLFDSPNIEKFQKLTFLSYDFTMTAQSIGMTIIKEKHLPLDHKTIQPEPDLGGLAGGEKFMHRNIMFKFTQDPMVDSQTHLYGGSKPNEIAASKSAGNELRGLSTFFQNVVDLKNLGNNIHLPLMCIIDYYGYRLIAISILPITKNTIIYGSNDGGKTVNNVDNELSKMMKIIGDNMKLKGHISGAVNTSFIYGPGDLEIHKSTIDSKFYALDFGRLFPPLFPLKEKREIFYKLFRPEFLKLNSIALSSDVFSGWSSKDVDKSIHEQEVKLATDRLLNDHLKEMVVQLETDWTRGYLNFSSDLGIELHKKGMNLGLLGRIRSITNPFIQNEKNQTLVGLILCEMVARVLKQAYKQELCKLKIHHQSDSPVILATVQFLNRILSKKNSFWFLDIKQMIQEKYNQDHGLDVKELESSTDLLPSISLNRIIERFSTMVGLDLDSRIFCALNNNNSGLVVRVVTTDIKQIRPVLKHSNMIDRSNGIALYMQATQLIYSHIGRNRDEDLDQFIDQFNTDHSQEISLLLASREKLQMASRSSTTDASLYHLLGLVELELFKLRSNERDHLLASRSYLQISISFDSGSISALIALATVYSLLDNHDKAQDCFKQLINQKNCVNNETLVPLLYEGSLLYSTRYNNQGKLNRVSFHILLNLFNLIDDSTDLYSELISRLITIEMIYYGNDKYSQLYEMIESFQSPKESNFLNLVGPILEKIFSKYPNLLDDYKKDGNFLFGCLLVSNQNTCPSFFKKVGNWFENVDVSPFTFTLANKLYQYHFEKYCSLSTNHKTLQIRSRQQLELFIKTPKNILKLFIFGQDTLFGLLENQDLLKHFGATTRELIFEQMTIHSKPSDGLNHFKLLESIHFDNHFCSKSPIISMIINNFLMTLKRLTIGSYGYTDQPFQEELELEKFDMMESLHLGSSKYYQIKSFPKSLQTLTLSLGQRNILELVSIQCPNLHSIIINDPDSEFYHQQLYHLKLNRLQSFKYHCNGKNEYLEKNQFNQGLQCWIGLSKLFLMVYHPYDGWNDFFKNLPNLSSLTLQGNEHLNCTIQSKNLENLNHLRIISNHFETKRMDNFSKLKKLTLQNHQSLNDNSY
ncbi:hypothetical protein DFA_07055 [Cavenderia fasciculata]|uniref:Clu domain-containing protein n=1 Tax=Cavenderia fasciculata TaxID=261658 RepID=F4PVD2_CACFS|nr:uncharacterized protein DFA_07055 [Cavenderia fasciculata]EGG19946.1 hypothetical protein DFA_07055 [Cavenderia fasciculata]|eukprot:XP_004366929.1 hypothetical protein DFA_07055 [Cavenderia fasciculata]